MIFTYKSK